ncbi:transmembrane-type terpene cyclase [Paraclostridium bifermentans]|uniref:transmembrane-type terpene cyclase n=1 Tax=Paraclostridium bifermentans TaxID=1490 RepID=UPI00359C208C
MNIELLLELLCGVFWIITYIMIILKSFKDNTYGMPIVALVLNLAWEFTFSFIYPPENFLLAKVIFMTWLTLDFVILYTVLRYGYRDIYCKNIINKQIYIVSILILISFSIVFMILASNDFSILYENSIYQAAGFIANLQNLIMSILFVNMILRRGNLKGQSIYIGLFKWIGTLMIAILKFSGILPYTITELFIIFLIQIFDILYIYLIYRISYKKCR